MIDVKLIAGLSAILLLSLAGNVAAVYMLGESAAKQDATEQIAEARGRADAMESMASSASLVATMAQADISSLVSDLRGVADRARQRVTVYRDRQIPQATCAPGPERVDAINWMLNNGE